MNKERFRIGRVFFDCSLVVFASAFFCSSANAINPPSNPNSPILGISPMTLLNFSNLTVGESYQMQHKFAWYWTNLPLSFTATNAVYTQMVPGVVQNGDYRLAQNPVPSQAFAVAQMFNGSVIGGIITDGGSGYATAPTVSLVRGGGTNATSITSISSSGVVTNITIISGGSGYTNAPIVQIAQPLAVAVSPWTKPVIRLSNTSIGWLLQFKPEMGAGWQNYNVVTNTQLDLLVTNDCGFFRLIYP